MRFELPSLRGREAVVLGASGILSGSPSAFSLPSGSRRYSDGNNDPALTRNWSWLRTVSRYEMP